MIVFPGIAYLMTFFTSHYYVYLFVLSFVNIGEFFIGLQIIDNFKDSKLYKILFIIFFVIKNIQPRHEYNEFTILFIFLSFLYLNKYFQNKESFYLFIVGISLSMAMIVKQSCAALIILLITIPLFICCLKFRELKAFILYAVGGLIPAVMLLTFAFQYDYLYEILTIPRATIKEGPLSGWTTTVAGYDSMNTIRDFVKTHDNVIRIYQRAGIDSIYIGEYQGYADLCMKGNYGSQGVNLIWDEVMSADYIITNNIWLPPDDYQSQIIDYFEKNNYKKEMLDSKYAVWTKG